MIVQTVSRESFHICGFATETTLENNDADIAVLYRDFFATGKEQALLRLPGCQHGCYGLEWYTEGHKSFFYLLGKEVSSEAEVPAGALIKHIPAALYAVARIPAETSLVEAWTEFFYTAVPDRGYAPDENHGFYFEFYPKNVNGVCELWAPVIKKTSIK
jgi:predicted transcriptional regulator YdeE